MWSRIRPILQEAFWPLVACLALALSAELYMRWFVSPAEPNPYHTSLYTHDGHRISDTEGPVQLELSTSTFYRTRPNQQTDAFSTNSLGLRGEEVHAKGDRLRVLFLGASTAFGVGARSNDETFVERLGRMHDLEVINGAVIGFVAAQQLAFLSTELLALQPDLVITVDAYADIFDAWYGATQQDTRKPEHQAGYNTLILPQVETHLVTQYQAERSVWVALGQLGRTTLNYSRLLSAANERLGELRGRIARGAQRDATALAAMPDTYYNQTLDSYVDTLTRIHRVCAEWGALHVSVLQPDLGLKSTRTEDEQRYLDEINTMVPGYIEGYVPTFARFTKDAETRLADSGIEVLNSNDAGPFMHHPETMFVDMAHLSPEGHEVFAEIVSDWLKKRDILGRIQND